MGNSGPEESSTSGGSRLGEPVPDIGIDHRIKGMLLLVQPVHQGKGIGNMNVVVHCPVDEQQLANTVLGHTHQA